MNKLILTLSNLVKRFKCTKGTNYITALHNYILPGAMKTENKRVTFALVSDACGFFNSSITSLKREQAELEGLKQAFLLWLLSIFVKHFVTMF